MSGMRQAAQGLAGTENEILAEKAATLARIAGRLEALLQQLGELSAGLEALSVSERAQAIEAYGAVREQARLYRWYVEVQREALGLLRHEGLDELYPVPEPIPPESPSTGGA